MEFEFSVPRPKRGGVGKEESKTPTFPIQTEECIYIHIYILLREMSFTALITDPEATVINCRMNFLSTPSVPILRK